LLENIGIVLMIDAFPTKLDFVSKLTSFSIQTKWIFAGLTFAMVIENLVYYLVNEKARQK